MKQNLYLVILTGEQETSGIYKQINKIEVTLDVLGRALKLKGGYMLYKDYYIKYNPGKEKTYFKKSYNTIEYELKSSYMLKLINIMDNFKEGLKIIEKCLGRELRFTVDCVKNYDENLIEYEFSLIVLLDDYITAQHELQGTELFEKVKSYFWLRDKCEISFTAITNNKLDIDSNIILKKENIIKLLSTTPIVQSKWNYDVIREYSYKSFLIEI